MSFLNIHGRIPVLGLWETETYSGVLYWIVLSLCSDLNLKFSVKTMSAFFAQNAPDKRHDLNCSYPLPLKRPVDVKRGTLEYVDSP